MGSVSRYYVEEKPGFVVEVEHLFGKLHHTLGLTGLTGIRVLRRYDMGGMDAAVYAVARTIVFSGPQVDALWDEVMPAPGGEHALLTTEALPNRYDQQADSCARCIQVMRGGERPAIRAATIYVLEGALTTPEAAKTRDYLINPVGGWEVTLDKPTTPHQDYPVLAVVLVPDSFTTLDRASLKSALAQHTLVMDLADLAFLQAYFRDEEGHDSTLTEVRMVNAYWSDHCRRTTFSTHLDAVEIADDNIKAAYEWYLSVRVEVYGAEKAAKWLQTLVDIATLGAKTLEKRGLLLELDESEEISACSIHVPVQVDRKEQDWLLMLENETHDHPAEVGPSGDVTIRIGGCICSPLLGRIYVHRAMRLTGCGDPRTPVEQILEGKPPQRRIAQTAAVGYSPYGNQIGLAINHVVKLYHEGYVIRHLECSAVMGATPAPNVHRERLAPGNVAILLGGRTGWDGIGGTTSSSKSHNKANLGTMTSEVQKGNAPEERKSQRLFCDPAIARLIKRCSDFGTDGVSVAIGELVDGLSIDLDVVYRRYDGPDGIELTISRSQEHMAVAVAPADMNTPLAATAGESLEAYPVASVTTEPRMVITWRGQTVASLSRVFPNANGMAKHIRVSAPQADAAPERATLSTLREMAASLKCVSRRSLAKRFDGSIGTGSVLMLFGDRIQRTPAQVMATLFSVEPEQETGRASVMARDCDPGALSTGPYRGAKDAVYASVVKLAAAGADYRKAYLTLQGSFEKLQDEPARWDRPLAVLPGALDAQSGLGCAAIGSKDSISDTFHDLDASPTLISFVIAPIQAGEVLSPEFKKTGRLVYLSVSDTLAGHPMAAWDKLRELYEIKKVKSTWTVGHGFAEAVVDMSFGSKIGFTMGPDVDTNWYTSWPRSIVAELTEELDFPLAIKLGTTTAESVITIGGDSTPIDKLLALNEGVLEDVHPTRAGEPAPARTPFWDKRSPTVCESKTARPRVVILMFPGTNCEYGSARVCLRAGLEPEIVMVRSLTASALEESALALEKAIRMVQILLLPGGFSGDDKPDGSAKLICSFLCSGRLTNAVHDLLERRDGLILGIYNGLQALIKLDLAPYGETRVMDEGCPTLILNTIDRHQSRYITTRMASTQPPWILQSHVDNLHAIPISHGESCFATPQAELEWPVTNGQIAVQYVDASGAASMDIDANPNGSLEVIEGIFSPDGRMFGKMGHSERRDPYVGINILGDKYQPLFENDVAYFR